VIAGSYFDASGGATVSYGCRNRHYAGGRLGRRSIRRSAQCRGAFRAMAEPGTVFVTVAIQQHVAGLFVSQD
jgi:hypothetical protein